MDLGSDLRDTRLVPTWLIGDRSRTSATLFMEDLADRMRYRIRLTTDALKAYVEAVEGALGRWRVDHWILRRLYPDPGNRTARTGYVKRQNLTMRMSMRRYQRATIAFSKKLENHAHAVALHFMAYNFCRPHRSLGRGVTPAMAARVADRQWEMSDIVRLIGDSN